MVEAIGRASLGADDKLIWHLTKVRLVRAGRGGGQAAPRRSC